MYIYEYFLKWSGIIKQNEKHGKREYLPIQFSLRFNNSLTFKKQKNVILKIWVI